MLFRIILGNNVTKVKIVGTHIPLNNCPSTRTQWTSEVDRQEFLFTELQPHFSMESEQKKQKGEDGNRKIYISIKPCAEF